MNWIDDGPSPHGEGGLKFLFGAGVSPPFWSLPSRGGWIEILVSLVLRVTVKSLSSRGGWIEIQILFGDQTITSGPSPHGEGGLKCAE